MRYKTDFITSLFFALEVKQTADGSSFKYKFRYKNKFIRFIWNIFLKNHTCKLKALKDE